MPTQIDSITGQLLRQAIHEKRLVRFVYQGKTRIAEPHDYGVMKGVDRLFCYQLRGESSGPLPNWRLVDLLKISKLELLNQTFAGSREAEYEKHFNWDKIYARVDDA